MNIPRLSLQRLKTSSLQLVKTRPRLLLALSVVMLVLAAGIGSAIFAAGNSTLVIRLIPDEGITEGDTGTIQATIQLSLTESLDTNEIATVTAFTSPTSGNPATLGDDYLASEEVFTFTSSIDVLTYTVEIVGDETDELAEAFEVNVKDVTVTGSPDPTVISVGNPVDVYILDDDSPTFVSLVGPGTVNEADGTATFTITMDPADPTSTVISPQKVQLDYEVTPIAPVGEALPADVQSITGTWVISPNTSVSDPITFGLGIVDDMMNEQTEEFQLQLTATAPGDNVASDVNETVNFFVLDDDVPTISFGTSAITVTEDAAGTVPITFTSDIVPYQDVTIQLNVTSATATTGTGTTPPDDFTPQAAIIFTAAGGTSQNIAITDVITDTVFENNETVVFELGAVSPAGSALVGSEPFTLTIQDDDPPPDVSFDVATSSVTEGLTQTITVNLVGNDSALDITVPYSISTSSTATGAGTDYTAPTPDPLVIPAGDTSADISIPTVDDTTNEASETVILDLGTPTAPGGVALSVVAPTSHTLTITDNDDPPDVTFAVATSSVTEGLTQTITVNLVGNATTQPITVPYTINASSTATGAGAGTDYTVLTPDPLVIPAGDTSATIEVSAAVDATNEASETVIFDLGTPTAPGGVTLNVVNPASHTLTILDSDNPPDVTFTVATSSPGEDEGTAKIEVSLTGNATEQIVTVPFSVDTLSSTADDPADYTVTTLSPLTFAPGVITQTIAVAIVDDGEYEGSETVVVDLGTPSVPEGTQPGVGTTQHTLTIVDDDLPTVQFDPTTSSWNEADGTVPVTVTLSAKVIGSDSVTVPFSVTGTAVSPADYSIATSSVLFSTDEQTKTISISIANDALNEGNETVILTLGTPTGAELGIQTTHTLTIIDDDPEPFVDFTLDNSNVTEGLTTTIEVSLRDPVDTTKTIPSGREVQVGYTRIGGTATSGLDYNPVSGGTLIFAPGETTQTFTVTTIQDEIDEPSETVLFALSSATNANLATTPEHTLTIVDDDGPPEVIFDVATSSEAEGKTAKIDVRLTGESSQAITVTFSIGGTAPITDYTVLPTSPLVFAPGEVLKTIEVNLADNDIYQLDRTVVFSLAIDPAAVGLAVLGIPDTHTLTIEDDDGPIASFSPTTDTVEEANTTVQVTINLDQSIIAGDSPVLDLVIGTGTTAQEGVDFKIPASVQFNAGDNRQTFDIEILNNELDEPDRTLVLTLSPQEGSNIQVPEGTSYTLTIIDDDETPIANADTYEVDEDNVLTVAAPGVLENDTDADGDTLTAEKVTDPDPAKGTLTFNADGSFTYTPNANFFGTDTFTYKASDGTNESGVATVTITINSVNDAPVANDDTLTIVQNTTRPVNVLANDTDVDGDALSVDAVTTEPANGTVAISGDRQAINYTPNPGYLGQDSFEYRVCDNGAPPACDTATVTVNVIEGKVYLPLIIGPGVVPPQAADLVISDFRLQPNKTNFSAGESVTVIVEVTNQGNIPVSQDFWVDFYINPEDIDANPVVPTVNQRWDELCRDGAFTGNPCYYGIVWLVEDDIAPGESVTLKSTTISSLFSRWPGYFVNGTERLYVQVDSWNPGVSTGAVAESNEANNLASILNITVSGSNPSVLADDLPTEIPPRPRP